MAQAAVSRRIDVAIAALWGSFWHFFSVTLVPLLLISENGVAIDFVGGFTHPIFGPDHVVAMVAVDCGARSWVCRRSGSCQSFFPLVMAVAGAFGVLGRAAAWCRNGHRIVGDRSWRMVAFAAKPPLWVAAVLVAPSRSSWACAWRRASSRSGRGLPIRWGLSSRLACCTCPDRLWDSFPLAGRRIVVGRWELLLP